MAELTSRLRALRTGAGFTQAALAGRVGVSRQAIASIEGGKQVPSTAVSLRLARVLRCTVEDLFALTEPTLGLERAPIGRVVIGNVDGVWKAHPAPSEAHAADGIVRSCGPVELLTPPEALEQTVLVAGCAPLLGVLTSRLGRRFHPARATWVPANSSRALAHLSDGSVHLAGLHLSSEPGGHARLLQRRFPGRALTLVHLTRWRAGLVLPAGNPLSIRSVSDLGRPGLRWVLREPGSGAAKLLEQVLEANGVAKPMGVVASGHAEVARRIAWGAADVGIAIETAALALGLDFLPLSEERFDLVLPTERESHAPTLRLIDLLGHPSFRREAERLAGYDVSMAGHATSVAG